MRKQQLVQNVLSCIPLLLLRCSWSPLVQFSCENRSFSPSQGHLPPQPPLPVPGLWAAGRLWGSCFLLSLTQGSQDEAGLQQQVLNAESNGSKHKHWKSTRNYRSWGRWHRFCDSTYGVRKYSSEKVKICICCWGMRRAPVTDLTAPISKCCAVAEFNDSIKYVIVKIIQKVLNKSLPAGDREPQVSRSFIPSELLGQLGCLGNAHPGCSAFYAVTNSGLQVRNGFGLKWNLPQSAAQSSLGDCRVPARAAPTRTSHICRSGWTQERSRLRRTPAAPAEKGVKCWLNPDINVGI